MCEYVARMNITQKLETRVQELQEQLYQATIAQSTAAVRTMPKFGELNFRVQPLRPTALPPALRLNHVPNQIRAWSAGESIPPQLRLSL